MKVVVQIDTVWVPQGIGRPCVIVVDCPDYDQKLQNYYRAVQQPAMEAALEKMKEWSIYHAPMRIDVYPVDTELVVTEKP